MIDIDIDLGLDLGLTESKEEKKENLLMAKMIEFENRHYMQVKAVKGVLKCQLPKEGQEWFFVSQNIFNQFAFVLTLLELEGDIEELYISSYNIKPQLTGTLKKLLEAGRVGKAFVLITETIEWRMPIVYGELKKLMLENENFDVKFTNNHTKIGLMKTYKGNYYVVSGSGNFTATNSKMEQYQFCNDKRLYDFYLDYFKKAKHFRKV